MDDAAVNLMAEHIRCLNKMEDYLFPPGYQFSQKMPRSKEGVRSPWYDKQEKRRMELMRRQAAEAVNNDDEGLRVSELPTVDHMKALYHKVRREDRVVAEWHVPAAIYQELKADFQKLREKYHPLESIPDEFRFCGAPVFVKDVPRITAMTVEWNYAPV